MKIKQEKEAQFQRALTSRWSCLANNTQDAITALKVKEMEYCNGMSHVDTPNAWALSLQNLNVHFQRVKAIMFFIALRTGHKNATYRKG